MDNAIMIYVMAIFWGSVLLAIVVTLIVESLKDRKKKPRKFILWRKR